MSCGKEIPIYSKSGRRKHYCTGHSPYNFIKGRTVPEEVRTKIAKTLETTNYFIGKHLTEKHKKNISAAKKGKVLGWTGRTDWSDEQRQKMSDHHKNCGYWGSWVKGKPMPEAQKKKISVSNKGKKPVLIKSKPYFTKSGETILFRSSWEREFAFYLDSIDELWYYEFWTFDLGNTTYTPDFYLPRRELFIEIKGRWIGKNKEKYERFLDEYCFVNIMLIQQKPPYNNINFW